MKRGNAEPSGVKAAPAADSVASSRGHHSKTIDDVTREELADLAEAAINLLASARFMLWLGGQDTDDDQSCADDINRMARALDAIGLPQCSTSEFIANLEALLKSGMPPDQWRAMHEAGHDV